MLNFLLRNMVKGLLWLRYRIRVVGLEAVAAKGTGRILFLPNHPALIDPIILLTYLNTPFAARALAVEHQVDRFFIRWLARRIGVRTFPDPVRHGPAARTHVEAAVAACIDDLRAGHNLVLYPSGHLYRSRREDLRGNTALEQILRDVPTVRVVLIRTRGLWGSRFSWASGRPPSVGRTLRKGLAAIGLGGIVFVPRRRVTVELWEPADLPRDAAREDLNRYVEDWYNADAPPNTYVPYYLWEGGGTRPRPEPPRVRPDADPSAVPESTRRVAADHLRELTGAESFADGDDLARDLGLDSLARAELVGWLEGEFGLPATNADAIRTVGDVMLAAAGQLLDAEPKLLDAVPAKWFRGQVRGRRLGLPDGETIPEVFLSQARRRPGRPILADQRSGVKTYRDVVLGVLALRPALAEMPGERLGIMLPASVAASVTYLAALFAGKTPVMVNWTVGQRNIIHSLEAAGVERVITAGALVARLAAQGLDLSALAGRFVMLERLAGGLSRLHKLRAFAASRLSWSSLENVRVSPTAAILFTSGSESLPKAVPLTHANILTNLREVLHVVRVYADDSLVCLLPPFHSFGLTANVVAPLCGGVRGVYQPDPNDALTLAQLVQRYRCTLVAATPTFLGRIMRASRPGQLDTLRIAITGAEKCPQRLYDAFARQCPNATVLEGYGVTECAPIVSINDERDPRPLTIGKLLPSYEHAIVDVEAGRRVATGERGMLLVRGPCVFDGYLDYDGPSPFVELDGRQWYRTGDLVSESADGVLTFRGRLKRFVKLGGEMISLPAIEAVLQPHYAEPDEEGPTIAVVAAGPEEQPELVLFTTRPGDRASANGQIREAGLSALHNIRRVVEVDELPLLGTGKVDYRKLEARLREGA